MKKIFLLLAFTGCASLEWEYAGSVDIPSGMIDLCVISDSSIGIIGEYIVTVGGGGYAESNAGGKTYLVYEYSSDMFVYNISKGLELSLQTNFPVKTEGAVVLQSDNEILLVGGRSANEDLKSIYSITMDGAVPIVKEIAALPFAWSSGTAVLVGRDIYLFSGRKDAERKDGMNFKSYTRNSWVFNLDTQQVRAIADMPFTFYPYVSCFPHAVLGGGFYVFDGFDIFHGGNHEPESVSVYRYDFEDDTWSKVKDSAVFNSRKGVLRCGKAFAVNDKDIAILGLKYFDNIKSSYPNPPPLNMRQMIYNTARNKWGRVRNAPPAEALYVKQGDNIWMLYADKGRINLQKTTIK